MPRRMGHAILSAQIEASVNRPYVGNAQLTDHDLVYIICAWLSCAFLSVIIERFKLVHSLRMVISSLIIL